MHVCTCNFTPIYIQQGMHVWHCMHECIFVSICPYTHIVNCLVCTHAYMYECMHAHIEICMFVVCMHLCTHAFVRAHRYAYMNGWLYVGECVGVSICCKNQCASSAPN